MDTKLRSDEVRGVKRVQPRVHREDRPADENRQTAEDPRVEMFRKQFAQAALPDLPPIPGYHVIWLTSTNPRDSIPMRMRMGYELIKASDIVGWEHASVKTGEYAGFIGVNEMLAFKLPLELYQAFMMEAHHDAPLREQEKLTSTADFLMQQAAASGAQITEGDGLTSLREPVARPTFAG